MRLQMNRAMLAVLLGLLLPACGGGSGATFGGGISGTGKQGVRVGALESDSAVVVDGITFDAAQALVTVNGATTAVQDLREGMVAVVTGIIDGNIGAASSVRIEKVIKGPIAEILDETTMLVLGQVIEITPTTKFGSDINPASLAGLVVGEPVEVYGFLKAPGVISAARVDRAPGLEEVVLTGQIKNLNAEAKTFDIGAQPIDYREAELHEFGEGGLANGQLVEVEGEPTLDGLGRVVATEIERISGEGGGGEEYEDVEIEGFVTQVTSATEFVVGVQTVRTTAGTQFDGGSASEIVVGIRLEVEGRIAEGVLMAEHIEFGDAVKLESDVATRVGNTITLVGLPGIQIHVNASTQYEGDADTLSDVAPGDHVIIRGRVAGESTVTGTLVDERSADNDVILQGPVGATPEPSDPTLSIFGVSVNTSSISNDHFRGNEEQTIGRSAFFAAAGPGALVKLAGTLSGSVVTWDEAELEYEDD